MEVKKSPKADLERHKFVFRLIGLSIALILMITVFQLKSFSDLPTQDIVERVNPDTEVLPPVVYRSEKAVPEKKKTIEPKEVEPKKPAKRPKKLVVVNKTIEIPNKPWEEVPEIIPGQSKHEVLEAIPFISVEELPVFPGCEGLRGEDRERCFVEMMWNHIQDNFHYPEISREMRTEGKVFVSFVIDAEGRVTQVEAVRGPDKHLKAEGERLLNSMPVMISPAKQRGKPVPVSYAVPINFQLQ